ncbi:hypothetical protein MKX03_000538 [Papaver bracteatum]|nr:hypothetical protein MKX03_000538 [Papaver bracteatum]
MDTMLNGAAIMDGAPLLVASNESCPQPQTSEHLVMGLQHIIILQNKVAVQEFIQNTVAEGAAVIPKNTLMLCANILEKDSYSKEELYSIANMIVMRSFDVNKPGSEVDEIKGGVAGGSRCFEGESIH